MKAGIQESTVALTDDAVRDVDSRMAAKSVKSESGGFGENILWPHTLHGEGDWEDGGYRLLFGVWHSHQQCWVHRSMMSEFVDVSLITCMAGGQGLSPTPGTTMSEAFFAPATDVLRVRGTHRVSDVGVSAPVGFVVNNGQHPLCTE